MRRAARVIPIVVIVALIGGCGSDDSSPNANSFKPTKAQRAVCKDFGGVSPTQRWVPQALPGGTRCKDDVITDGETFISRPDGGWNTLPPRRVGSG